MTSTHCGNGEGGAGSFEPPGNVLLRGPSLREDTTEVCPAVGAHERRNLLLISLSGNPGLRLDAWKRQVGLPGKVAILTTEELPGAVDADTGSAKCNPRGTTVSRTTVSEPGDLTGIGIRSSQCLSGWADEDVPTDVCFDSITTLLQFAGTRRTFRFLHVMTERVASTDSLAHYHIDPGAHDEQTLATVESIFGRILEFDSGTDSWVEQ